MKSNNALEQFLAGRSSFLESARLGQEIAWNNRCFHTSFFSSTRMKQDVLISELLGGLGLLAGVSFTTCSMCKAAKFSIEQAQ